MRSLVCAREAAVASWPHSTRRVSGVWLVSGIGTEEPSREKAQELTGHAPAPLNSLQTLRRGTSGGELSGLSQRRLELVASLSLDPGSATSIQSSFCRSVQAALWGFKTLSGIPDDVSCSHLWTSFLSVHFSIHIQPWQPVR